MSNYFPHMKIMNIINIKWRGVTCHPIHPPGSAPGSAVYKLLWVLLVEVSIPRGECAFGGGCITSKDFYEEFVIK